MEPKDKALDILVKLLESTPDNIVADNSEADELCKVHALIVVSEVMADIPQYLGNLNPKWYYWNEVRKELEKL